MTWNDFYQRQHAIRAAIEDATTHPDAPLTVDTTWFTDSDDLLAALQHKWTQALTGRLNTALDEAANAPGGDRVEAVTDAWWQTRRANESLRAILDRHQATPGPALRKALNQELRMLALTAGLAEHCEDATTSERIGTAFRRLIETSPRQEPETRPARPWHQLRELLHGFRGRAAQYME